LKSGGITSRAEQDHAREIDRRQNDLDGAVHRRCDLDHAGIAGASRREIAKAHPVVVTREGG